MNKRAINEIDPAFCVAVIGIALRLPGADTKNDFWNHLKEGAESISHFTKQQLEHFFKKSLPEDSICSYGILHNIDQFDAVFFGMTPREAQLVDTQQRMFLECCWEALEDGAIDPSRCKGSIGVFAGSADTDYDEFIKTIPESIENTSEWQLQVATGMDFLASRVAYKLNLKGPAIALQTGCSTSMVAISQAVQSLLMGESDYALAGGSSVHTLPKIGQYVEGAYLSPDGHCRTFDSEAKGTVASNGSAVVLLQRLEDAIANGSPINAVILGAAVNNDGSRKIGFTAPSIEGQIEAIRKAHRIAGVESTSIQYVECHGTATPVGDPIEIAALSRAFTGDRENKCTIGSVKSNIGHTDTAAGVAGLIKVICSMQHKMIPPTVHYHVPNPALNLQTSPFKINKTLENWYVDPGQPRRAGVSSFGIGGTNAHVVLQEAPQRRKNCDIRKKFVIPLSAKTKDSLISFKQKLSLFFKDHSEISLSSVASTLQEGRQQFQWRSCVTITSTKDLTHEQLTKSSEHLISNKPSVVLMFPGQGGQYLGMGKILAETEPVFEKYLNQCHQAFLALGIDINKIIHADFLSNDILQDTPHVQAAIFSIEYSLGQFILSFIDSAPVALVGHSLGMYAASCIAGIFSFEDACKIIAERSRLLAKAPAGAMVSVKASLEQCEHLLSAKLSLSLINTNNNFVVSGHKDAIEIFEQKLEQLDIVYRRLHISVAGHSHLMQPFFNEYQDFLDTISKKPPCMPIYSDISGDLLSEEQASSSEYWASHLTSTVNINSVFNKILAIENAVLIEVGPGKSITMLARGHQHYDNQALCNTMQHPLDDLDEAQVFGDCVAQLWLNGVPIHWENYNNLNFALKVSLPTYAFDKKTIPLGNYDFNILQGEFNPEHTLRNTIKPDTKKLQITEQDEITSSIIGCYQNIIGLNEVHADNNFFELGGDSLMAIQVLKVIKKNFGVGISIKTIFKHPSPRLLAKQVKKITAGISVK